MQLNERELAIPDKKFQKRYTKKNHFAKKKRNEEEINVGSGPSPLGDDENFDKDVAIYAFNSPEARTSSNPLFMNTRAFNVSTTDYKLLKTQKSY